VAVVEPAPDSPRRTCDADRQEGPAALLVAQVSGRALVFGREGSRWRDTSSFEEDRVTSLVRMDSKGGALSTRMDFSAHRLSGAPCGHDARVEHLRLSCSGSDLARFGRDASPGKAWCSVKDECALVAVADPTGRSRREGPLSRLADCPRRTPTRKAAARKIHAARWKLQGPDRKPRHQYAHSHSPTS
jgi:hypothetical protein